MSLDLFVEVTSIGAWKACRQLDTASFQIEGLLVFVSAV
jgi:hypothetical protein